MLKITRKFHPRFFPGANVDQDIAEDVRTSVKPQSATVRLDANPLRGLVVDITFKSVEDAYVWVNEAQADGLLSRLPPVG
jgi:hypothetical protein